jgi:subtilisin family serine protease
MTIMWPNARARCAWMRNAALALLVAALTACHGARSDRSGGMAAFLEKAGLGYVRSVDGVGLVSGERETARVYRLAGKETSIMVYPRPGGADALVSADELIVAWSDDVPNARDTLAAALTASGGEMTIVKQIPLRNIFLIRLSAPADKSPGDLANGLKPFLPASAHVEANSISVISSTQDLVGSDTQIQWALRNNGPAEDEYTFGGTPDADIDGMDALSRMQREPVPARRPIVAVLDTGVDVFHARLAGQIWHNAGEVAWDGIDNDRDGWVDNIRGWDFLADSPQTSDFTGHGTHVAGIIAANAPLHYGATYGVAPQAQIMSLRTIFGRRDRTGFGELFDQLNAFTFARRQKADVINMSSESYVYSELQRIEIEDSFRAGIVVVAAAGNGLPDGVGKDVTKTPVYPCVLPFVICVAATDANDKLAPFSNYGVDPQRTLVAISAPGVGIWSTTPGGHGEPYSGTSMATPMVAGAVAALKAVHSSETELQRRVRLLGSADRLVAFQDKVEEGRRLNLYQAIFGPRPPGVSMHDQSAYCLTKVPDPVSGAPLPRWTNTPYANSGEPGIDGSSPEKAFALCTTQQLIGIEDADLAKHFRLAQDIRWSVLGEGGHPIGGGPRPVGQPPLPFEGTFDGAGFSIIGMRMHGVAIAGLFARLGQNARVDRLRLRQVDLNARTQAGALAAQSAGMIKDVEAEGVVQAGESAGGLVGLMYGGVLNATFFEGHVIGTQAAGGLIGRVRTTASTGSSALFSLFRGWIEAPTAGGLIGEAGYRTSVLRSHAFVIISGADVAGGIVGRAACGGSIDSVYAEGRIDARSKAGGLVGDLGAKAYVYTSYASVKIAPVDARRGGAVGVMTPDLRSYVNGQPGNYVCSGTNSPAVPPHVNFATFYNSDLTLGPGSGGVAKTNEELRDPTKLPRIGRPHPLSAWRLEPGFMPALRGLPRSFPVDLAAAVRPQGARARKAELN